MDKKLTREELVKVILEDYEGTIDQDIEMEEMIDLLLQEKVSKNINHLKNDSITIGNKISDKLAASVGSWGFIISFLVCLFLWIILNAAFLIHPFDQYPFILLNLVLSCVAAIQAPVIMMSQNRQEEKDRLRAKNDYKVNLKSELIIEDLHMKLDKIIESQQNLHEKILKLEKQ